MEVQDLTTLQIVNSDQPPYSGGIQDFHRHVLTQFFGRVCKMFVSHVTPLFLPSRNRTKWRHCVSDE